MKSKVAVAYILLLGVLSFVSLAHAQEAPEQPPGTMQTKIVAPPSSDDVKFKANLFTLLWGRDIQDQFMKSADALMFIYPRVDVIYSPWLSFDVRAFGFFV